MKGRCSLILSCAFALALASPALAAWTPPPGWSVHEVPLPVHYVVSDDALASLAFDPLTGDLFLVGSLSLPGGALSLMRVSQAGQAQDLGPVTWWPVRPVFDPVHRVVLLSHDDMIDRFTEAGAPLGSIPKFAPGPFAIGPGGDLDALVADDQVPGSLLIVRYDFGISSWVPVRVAPPPSGVPPYLTAPPQQLVIDDAGRLFGNQSGALYRIDDTSTKLIGGALLMGQIAVAPGLGIFNLVRFDPDAPDAAPMQPFGTPPAGHAPAGVAILPGPTVVILDVTQGWDYALEIFTMSPTPAVHRSWGAVKALAR